MQLSGNFLIQKNYDFFASSELKFSFLEMFLDLDTYHDPLFILKFGVDIISSVLRRNFVICMR